MISKGLTTVNDIYKNYIESSKNESPVIRFNDETITVSEFKTNVEKYVKHMICMGVRNGDCVGYTIPNSPEAYYLFIAVSQLGAIAVPLFHMIPDIGKVKIYQKANVKYVITTSVQFDSFSECSKKANAGYKIATIDENPYADYNFIGNIDSKIKIEDYILKNTDKDHPMLIASSSGTTGIPKFVRMTQGNIAAEIYITIEMLSPVEVYARDVHYIASAFPLSTSGMITCIGMVFSGMCSIISADISPLKFLKIISDCKADSISAPPAFYEGMLSVPVIDTFNLTSVKKIIGGMDFLTTSLLQRLKGKFVNLETFAIGYGLVETANIVFVCKGIKDLLKPTNTMKLVEGFGNQMDVRDEEGNSISLGGEGELYIKGASVVSGYTDNAEETQVSFKDGWFKTGDIVRYEEENTITLLGRKKYLIKRGGKSVSPIVVQNHLNKLQGVKNSAVVGVPHQLYGEMVWAFIVKDGESDVQLKDIMKHCRLELANYMIPDQVSFIDEIPKNSGVGKVNFEKLKEIAGEELNLIQGGK